MYIEKYIERRRKFRKVINGFLPKLIKPAISLGKNILAPLGLSAAISATDAAIQKNKKVWFRENNFNNF